MKLTDNLQPKALLILYSNSSNNGFYSDTVTAENVYFEYAPIVNGIAGAAIPLSDTAAAALGAALATSAKTEVGGTIPDNLLYLGMDGIGPLLIWWTEPQKKRLLYSEDLMETGKAEFNIPYLLWFYRHNTLQLYAVKEKPKMTSKLYYAPFQNINKGTVCLGSGTKIIDKGYTSFENLMKLVELAFWGTKFNDQTQRKVIKGNLLSLHKSLNGTDNIFPLDVLLFAKKTINSLVNENEKTGSTTTTDDEEEINIDDEESDD